jgi:hypothetical protein
MDINANVRDRLKRIVQASAPDRAALDAALRLLSKWRSHLIQNSVIQEIGTDVQSGPFKGMRFVERSAEGCHVPKLLGSYEQELHPYIEAAIGRGYRHVINIGMAEGYYAVGMAMRLPSAQVHAFDVDDNARSVCREVAAINAVADRLQIGGLFKGEDFAGYPAGETLVICDIEGGEEELLDPARFPALLGFDLIVELHELLKPGLVAAFRSRFEATHDIRIVPHAGRDVKLPDLFNTLGHLDQLLAVWEWRSGPTPWAVMIRKP